MTTVNKLFSGMMLSSAQDQPLANTCRSSSGGEQLQTDKGYK
jgi:hypothetical protein